MPDARPSVSEREKEVLEFWEKNQIFKKSLEKDAPRGAFVFYEGPPTANGRPGIHHAEARAFKDLIPRFRTMQGFRVDRKGGWDTHGLPVELEVEKQLGFTGKAQIEEFGIAPFNEKCKESVWTYLTDWKEFTRRLGFWVDIDNAYVTYKSEYVEGLWGVIKKIWDRGLLYQDYRVTPHCPRCGTSLSSHELAQGYQDVKDISVYAKFKVVGKENEYLVAWTTTPWTLPSNVALAVGEKIAYVLVKKDTDLVWVARDLAAKLVPEGEIVREAMGSELVGTEYEPLYPFVRDAIKGTEQDKKGWYVAAADFVTTTDGTGIVHTAVMYGADDFELGSKIGLPKYHLVKLDGTFLPSADFLAGRVVTDEQVAIDIIKDLAHRGLLFAKEKYEHSYPHCWRCKSKVIYYAKDSWYIRMSSLRDQLLAENEKINWEPAHIQQGRFGEWLREVKDWAFSRERYWGTPLPIWVCEECGEKMCVGSFAELGVGADFDPHRPYVDEVVVKCAKCGGSSRRVKDVCDVWFDSGAMPFASGEYPTHYPADYICEAIDQTRGWFYTLLAVSVALGLERPVKNIICLGHVLDAKGKKMSKSLGNIVKPMEMIDVYGADAVRWYMYTINQPGESKRFDEKTLQEMQRAVFGILGNVVTFYETYAEGKPKPVAELDGLTALDTWMLARLSETVKDVTDGLEAFRVTEPARLVGVLIDEFSTWWLRRSRDRFKSEDAADKAVALAVMRECLLTIAKLMAPFTPFFAEDVYKRVGGEKESVHLEVWPTVDAQFVDEVALSQMAQTRSIVSKLLEARSNAGKNVRQALASATVTLPSGELGVEYVELIKDEVNVKEVMVEKGEYAVSLDVTLTPALVREGTVREIIRRVNAMRKNGALTIEDRIEVYVASPEAEIATALLEHGDALVSGVLATALRTTGDAPENAETFRANEFEITVGFTKNV
ncbi:isoleucine--tRNA ligase [bacterium]|nr:isoleucine--tRNA ligase [bacterium]